METTEVCAAANPSRDAIMSIEAILMQNGEEDVAMVGGLK